MWAERIDDAEIRRLWAQLACLWEATARKPGNVHRYRDFADATYIDFLTSAAVISSVLAAASSLGVGPTVLTGVRRTQLVAPNNTNLGILLLLAPLAAVPLEELYREALTSAPAEQVLREGLASVLESATVRDTAEVYQAIRLANPSGLGSAADQDVHAEPTLPLRQVMALAADRDLVARQYANGFSDVFDHGVPALRDSLARCLCLEAAIIACHLHLMARYPDSLIARKCGLAVAEEASARAQDVLDAGWPNTAAGAAALADLDGWLRADGHRRNPGTTADLVAACLFVALRTGIITLPLSVPWAAPFKLP